MKHPNEVTQVLEDIEMDLRKGSIDFKQADAARAAALAVSYRLAPKMDAALAACAEMRAALIHIRERAASAIGEDESDAIDICNAIERLVGSALGEGDPLTGDLPRHSDLARTDLGRGMVAVPRGVVERLVADLSAATPYAETDEGLARVTRDIATLASLLDGGKGR